MNNTLPLNFTDAAANRIKSLVTEENNPKLKFRVYITGGGCGGFQYGFTFEQACSKDDTVIEKHGVQLVIDPMSLQYLMGATVDYIQGLQGSRFIVINPNAKTTCSCGSSFAV